MCNRKYFDTNLASITSGGSLVSNGIDYSVIGCRPSQSQTTRNCYQEVQYAQNCGGWTGGREPGRVGAVGGREVGGDRAGCRSSDGRYQLFQIDTIPLRYQTFCSGIDTKFRYRYQEF